MIKSSNIHKYMKKFKYDIPGDMLEDCMGKTNLEISGNEHLHHKIHDIWLLWNRLGISRIIGFQRADDYD